MSKSIKKKGKSAGPLVGLEHIDVPRKDELTQAQLTFLTYYERFCNISRAAQMAGVHRSMHYIEWLKSDAYREAFEAAHRSACETIEETIYRLGIVGKKKYRFTKSGQPIMWVNPETGKEEHYYDVVHSEYLLIRLAEAAMPEKYCRRRSHEVEIGTSVRRIVLEDEGDRDVIDTTASAVEQPAEGE